MARFDDLQIQILYAIWQYAYKPGSSPVFNYSNLDEILPPEFISGATYAALGAFNSKEFLYHDGGNYSISEAGMTFIENGLEDSDSAVSRIVTRANEKKGPEAQVTASIPASDRLVALNHNSDPYKEAVRALDEAVAAFKEDCLLDNEWGSEKGALLKTIEAGRELLKEGQVRAATIFSTIVAPLQIVRDRYDHAIVAGLVTASADQLVASIGHAISSILSLIGLS